MDRDLSVNKKFKLMAIKKAFLHSPRVGIAQKCKFVFLANDAVVPLMKHLFRGTVSFHRTYQVKRPRQAVD